VFITNGTGQAFAFHTGSRGGGGSIRGPNYKARSAWDAIGTPPLVLPEFRFLADGTTNSWRAVGLGGPTRRAMRPAVVTVAPKSQVMYCQFEVENQLIAGSFVSGRINRDKLTSRDSEPVNIPITKLELKKKQRESQP
jgi:hypothetical protein